MATVQNQSAKTLKRKRYIAAQLKASFPGGAEKQADKVQRSQVAAWLAGYGFGSASYNLFLEFVRAVFALAVADRLLVHSPADGIKTKNGIFLSARPPH